MKVLRELAKSRNERVRLQAALRMSDILLEHQRSLERIAIAKERARARLAGAEGQPTPSEPEDSTEAPAAPQSAEEAARAFLAKINGSAANGDNNNAD